MNHNNTLTYLVATALAVVIFGSMAGIGVSSSNEEAALANAVAADLSDAQQQARDEFTQSARAAQMQQLQQQP